MKKFLLMALLASSALASAQTDYALFRKTTGLDQKTYPTRVNSSLWSINSSGDFTYLAQSNFANASHVHTASDITDFNSAGDARWSLLGHTHTFASLTSKPTTIAGYGITDFNSLGDARWSLLGHTHTTSAITDFTTTGDMRWAANGHTHVSADITDASTGGNDVADDRLLAQFNTEGQLHGSVRNSSTPAVWGSSTGTGYAGLFTGTTGSTRLVTPIAAIEVNSAALVIEATRTTSGIVAHLGGLTGTGMDVSEAGVCTWTSATGASGTRTGLGLGTLATQSGTFSGTHSGTSSGTNTGDQTITLTGDVTGSGTGSFAATIATGVIVNADINASAAIALSKLATDPLARANHTGTQAVSTISDATTVGQNVVKLTNPSAVTYARINADNTVTARTMAQSRTDLALHPVTITAITGGSQASTSTSLADVTGSTITFPDTGWYQFEYFIIHNSAATTTGAFYSVNTTGTMAQDFLTYCTAYDVANTDKDTYCAGGFNQVIASTSSRNASATNRCRMQGTIHVTTAGGMVLRFATEVNASAITITDLSGWYRNL